jgi:hypothetical protein
MINKSVGKESFIDYRDIFIDYNVRISDSLPEFNIKISQLKERIDGFAPYSIDISAPGYSQNIIQESWYTVERILEFEDWNFDGYNDLVIKVESGSTTPHWIKKFWLWSGDEFVENQQLNDITFWKGSVAEGNLVHTMEKLGPGTHQYLFYSYENSEYVLQKYIMDDIFYINDFDKQLHKIIKERINGKMIITKNEISEYKSK